MKSLRITKLKMKDFEAEFLEGVESAEKDLSEPNTRSIVVDEPISESKRELLEANPNYAVLDSWKEIEDNIRQISIKKLSSPTAYTTRRHIMALVNAGELTPEVGSALEELSIARNRIVHETDYKLSKKAASKYLDLAADVAGLLVKLLT